MTPGGTGALRADTIVAIATPPGIAAIGVIRVSGPRAIDAAASVIRLSNGRELWSARPRTAFRAVVTDPEALAPLDVALVTVMPGPNSYTGEDLVEISCHGNPVLLDRVVRLLLTAGTRLAEPGEFTRTAYLNGRIDLTQAEAVALLIEARTDRAIQLAARQLSGGISNAVRQAREQAVELIAGLEVALDFPDDDVGLSRSAALASAASLANCLERLVADSRAARDIHGGLRVVLAGAPNVGKSSLLNALLGRDRAIVSPVPGTTRDVIDGELIVAGVRVDLVDVAGLGTARDAIDAEAMRRSLAAVDSADLLVIVLDRSREADEDDRAALALRSDRPRLIVANKADLAPARSDDIADCTCSALTGVGLDSLLTRIEQWVAARTRIDGDEGGAVASLRVREHLDVSRTALARAVAALPGTVPLEAVLVDVRDCLTAMDQILGGATDDAILDRIFAQFCVGK